MTRAWDETIAAALAKRAEAIETVAPGRWAVTLSNGAALAARARVDDGWLLLDASLGDAAAADRAWDLLRWNATLDGGACFALRSHADGVHVTADVVLDDETDAVRRVADACAGLQAAHQRFVHADAPTAVVSPPIGTPYDLAALCRETTWGCVERDGGRLAVDLATPGAFHQALIEARGAGVAVVTPVLDPADCDGASPESACERALGLLLLRVCGHVRLVRAAAEPSDTGSQARLEVVFGTWPSATELTHALAALSVACRIASREAAVLWRNASIAQAYLAA